MTKQKIVRYVYVFLVFYILAYVVLSVTQGQYSPVAYGLRQNSNGQAILAPKKSLGYHWVIIRNEDGKFVLASKLIYLPLLYLDRLIWHRKKEAEWR